MDQAQWAQLKQIFEHLSDKTPSHRRDYLDMVCEDQPELREQVELLLEAHDETDSLESLTARTQATVPEQIGSYRIEGRLGQGGAGTVYSAVHPEFGPVALKVVPAIAIANHVARTRFEREATVLQQLQHPALCTLHEWFTDQEQAVLAIERIEGQELRELIDSGPLPRGVALEIVLRLTEVLEQTHALGIVHRDIKPSNVLIDAAGTVRLIDFGIAKFADEKLTATGTVLGTPHYMAPEQWRGAAMDARTDLWALGCLLFELVSGSKAFNGDDLAAASRAVLQEDPPALPDYSIDGQPLADIDRLIRSGLLVKSAEGRYASCTALLTELRTLAGSEGIQQR